MTAHKSKFYRTRERFMQVQQTHQQLQLQLAAMQRRIRKARGENDCLLDVIAELGLVECDGDADDGHDGEQYDHGVAARGADIAGDDPLDLRALQPAIRGQLVMALAKSKRKRPK